MQVIIVNDGSKDQTGEIANRLCEKYNNVIAIHLEESHYIGGFARNEGIKRATGKYLMFMDSDDKFDKDACKLMYDTIIENGADIVTANYKCMDQDGTIWKTAMLDQDKYKSGELDAMHPECFCQFCPSVAIKIFNTEMVQKNGIKFLEGVPAEDAYFSVASLLKSNKIYYLQDVVYFYRRRNTGEVSTSWMRNMKYFKDVNFAFKKIYELFERDNKLKYYKYFYARNFISLIYKFIDSKLITNEERVELLDEMHWFFEQSRILKITFEQRILEILIDYILEGKYEEAIRACDIVAEARKLMNEVQKEMMSKPQKMIIE